MLDEFPSISGPGAKVWLDTDAIFWLLLDGEKPVFVCWVFQSPARFKAAQGWLALPPGVALMEESAVSPSYRGRGTLAPAVWSQVADRLQQAGVASLIIKVEHDNKVMRWSLAKAGFRETFTVHFRRLGPVSRTTIRSADNTRVRWLAEQTGARVTSTPT